MVLAALMVAGLARADNLFDIRGRAAEKGVVTIDHALPEVAQPTSTMLERMEGVVGTLSAAEVKALRASIVSPSGRIQGVDESDLLCVVHLMAGKDTLTVEVRRTGEGVLIARRGIVPGEDKRQDGRVERLSEEKFFAISREWSAYRGSFEPAESDRPSQLVRVDAVHGWLTFNQKELGERLLRGRKTRVEGVERKLAESELWARAPKGYDPRSPAGLLVWVHASPNGQPPATIFPVADELGLVCISQADSGNDCPIADRYQRVLDSVATASRRYHIDPRRIYISGISGGGKVSSVMWACFPDVFAGCVPIVGLACYENIPIGNGQIWPGLFDKPPAPMFNLLKAQRAAAVTGPKDFNYDSIVAAAKILERDGLQARVFEHAELAHTMPSPEQFTEALKWIDEPYRGARDKELADAAELLAKAKAMPAGSPGDEASQARRKALIAVTEAGPWTPAAWEARQLMQQR